MTLRHEQNRKRMNGSHTFTGVITKAARSPQLFKDPECWSGRGFEPRPPARQSGAPPTELTSRQCAA